VGERRRVTELMSAPSSGGERASDIGARAESSPGEGRAHSRLGSKLGGYLGLAPFGVYTIVFLLVPSIAVLYGAFRGNNGGFTMASIDKATSGVYLKSFETSIELSVISAVVPGIVGILIAYTVVDSSPRSPLRRIVSSASGVFANFGGVPLAFLFIASIGSGSAVVIKWIADLGYQPYEHGFSIFKLSGVAVVYGYFQIPLMVLIITPALEGLKPAWREASTNLGGGSWAYWRYVGGPVLLPSALGSMLLLFGSSLASYATAQALTNGGVNLTPIQINNVLNGNVIANGEHLGDALGLGLVVIIAVVMVFYVVLQRRASKWSR
jgi:putative spermidine/putrescine transport system permease protein